MRVLFEIFGDRIVHGSSRLPPAQGTGGRPIAFGEWERTRCWVIMNWPRGQVVGVISRVEFAQRRSASHSLSVSLSVCWSPFVLLNIGGRSSSGAVYRSLFQPPTEKTKEVYPARGEGETLPVFTPAPPPTMSSPDRLASLRHRRLWLRRIEGLSFTECPNDIHSVEQLQAMGFLTERV